MLQGTPVVAIGGMDVARARSAMRAGASSVAVVGAITRSADPEAAIAELRWAIEAGAVEATIGDVDDVLVARSTLHVD